MANCSSLSVILYGNLVTPVLINGKLQLIVCKSIVNSIQCLMKLNLARKIGSGQRAWCLNGTSKPSR